MNNQVIQKITDIPLFFFIGLYFLIFICFFGSSLTTLNFLFTLNTNYVGSLLSKFLFLVFIILYLLNPKSGITIYNSLANNIVIDKIYNYLLKINKFTSKHPLVSFFFVYFYVLLLIIHWFMGFSGNIDIFLEFLYYSFNIIRLLLFPLVIYAYIAYYGPSSYQVELFGGTVNISSEELKKALKAAGVFVDQALKKYPKSTIGGTVVGAVGFSVAVGSLQHKKNVSDFVSGTSESPIVAAQLEKLNSPLCSQNVECQQLTLETIRIFSGINKTAWNVSFNDANSYFQGELTLSGKYQELIEKIPLVHAKLYKEALEKKEAELQLVHTEALASTSGDSKMEQIAQSSTSIVPKSHSPNMPLEEFWSFF